MTNRKRRLQQLQSMLKHKHGTKSIVETYRTKVLGPGKDVEPGLNASDMIPRIMDVEFTGPRS
ncbi:MAG TPA: hypothetical protein VM165_05690 [Planctomycetaceae bacterium]|nr:hypothetical protein [Planctomycetaceae bacterium]